MRKLKKLWDRFIVAKRLWGYRVGDSGLWVDTHLRLSGFADGEVISWRRAWDFAKMMQL